MREHLYRAKYSDEDIHRICQQAINRWGKQTQILMCIEECAELITVLAKADRKINSADREEIASEIADVGLMLRQVALVFGINDITLASIEEEKLDRLLEYFKREGKEAQTP